MVVPKTLQAYLSGSQIFGRYGDASELRAGANWYFTDERGLRVNAEWIHLNNCPVGYTAVPYPGRRQRQRLSPQPRDEFLMRKAVSRDRRSRPCGGDVDAQAVGRPRGAAPADTFEVNDTHLHLTNYVQEGTNIHDFVNIMGTKVGRAAIFGIPLQQQWSYGNTGDFAPTYYLQTDAPLYYYSFTDAFIAMAYRSLPPAEQARLDPMITGFNPTDMYAADHVRRVLTTFPGVFSGIGEFTIHKEFVSAKIAGETASLTNPALDRLLDFAGDVGLVALIHNDIDAPFPKPGQEPYQVVQLRDLFLRHPKTTIIWAHIGLGRVVRPVEGSDRHHRPRAVESGAESLYIDISWDETAKYIVASPETIAATADSDQPPSRSLPVRHRRGRAGRSDGVPEGLPDVRAAVRAADAGGQRAGAEGQLRAPVRRGQAPGPRVGEGQRQGTATMNVQLQLKSHRRMNMVSRVRRRRCVLDCRRRVRRRARAVAPRAVRHSDRGERRVCQVPEPAGRQERRLHSGARQGRSEPVRHRGRHRRRQGLSPPAT